jgi:hypothetical protein
LPTTLRNAQAKFWNTIPRSQGAQYWYNRLYDVVLSAP